MSQPAEYISQLPDIAEEVREFYDRHPYPPPVDNLDKYRQHWRDQQRRRADYHLFLPGHTYREDHAILVAGCGTAQAAKYALRWPNAQVVGIDCSAASVCHTEQLREKYGLKNLHVQQLTIERVSELGMSFDQIVCTGVLHHLADPDAGLNALRTALKPEGAMQIMVYAPYGRAGVYMLQKLCRRLGVHATRAGIRDLIIALRLLPQGHPLQSLLTQSAELFDEATLADSLLHPQDRAYSVPEFFDFIDKAGLTFGRWLRQAPYSVHCGVIAKIPQVHQIALLPEQEQYAAIELFRGTMIRHSAVLYRRDSPSSRRNVNFVSADWLNYVPVRMPDTVCVPDRLHVGATAVLINQTHTYRDLFLPIGPVEKHLFNNICEHRTIGDIVNRTLARSPRAADLDVAAIFFEQLWWHDQVVFATGYTPATKN